jgi:hypothetical protein
MVFGALTKNGSFGFAKSPVGQNQMCHLCRWLKLFLKNVRWEKIQKRGLLGWLSDGSFAQSLIYVLFCRSFLLSRLLGLPTTQIYTLSHATENFLLH